MAEQEPEIAAILDLARFDRFVFVMSVLEHYSDHECSILLGCSRRDGIYARRGALPQLRRRIEIQPPPEMTPAPGATAFLCPFPFFPAHPSHVFKLSCKP